MWIASRFDFAHSSQNPCSFSCVSPLAMVRKMGAGVKVDINSISGPDRRVCASAGGACLLPESYRGIPRASLEYILSTVVIA